MHFKLIMLNLLVCISFTAGLCAGDEQGSTYCSHTSCWQLNCTKDHSSAHSSSSSSVPLLPSPSAPSNLPQPKPKISLELFNFQHGVVVEPAAIASVSRCLAELIHKKYDVPQDEAFGAGAFLTAISVMIRDAGDQHTGAVKRLEKVAVAGVIYCAPEITRYSVSALKKILLSRAPSLYKRIFSDAKNEEKGKETETPLNNAAEKPVLSNPTPDKLYQPAPIVIGQKKE